MSAIASGSVRTSGDRRRGLRGELRRRRGGLEEGSFAELGAGGASAAAIVDPLRKGSCETVPAMREGAILKLDSGGELRVELDPDELDRDEIVVRRTRDRDPAQREGSLAVIDEHLAAAEPHPAGTTDRLLDADRQRPF